MFETAELGRSVPKHVYKDAVAVLRQELLALQQTLRELGRVQVIVVFAGVDGAGKGHTVNLLNEWMDPRWLTTSAFDEPSDEERSRPEFWRYWLALPPKGRIGMVLSSWYSPPVLERVYEVIDDVAFDRRLDRIAAFERALGDDGALILKFWMHLSREVQKQRLEGVGRDPLTQARATERDWQNWRLYDRFIETAERMIMRTNTGKAPWSIVEGTDPNYRALTVGTALRDALRRRIEEVRVEDELKARMVAPDKGGSKRKSKKGKAGGAATTGSDEPVSTIGMPTVLSQLDMSLHLDKATYRERLQELQARLHLLHRRARDCGVSSLVVFEGPDAAGKGGAIRRVTASLDARNYRVHSFAVPTDEESAQHYLWRFWRVLPRAGRFAIFDRSWYGRVLVERVEGFADEPEWRRAYAEINDFEEQLVESGLVLVKYWIHITKDEQLERFRSREQTPYKRWKLTEEDWRNRERWEDYEVAVNDMVQFTSTPVVPWTLVEGNDKRYARVKVLATLCATLESALGSCDGEQERPAAKLRSGLGERVEGVFENGDEAEGAGRGRLP